MNKRYKQKEVKNLLRNKKVDLVGLVETRAKVQKATQISANIAPTWGSYTTTTLLKMIKFGYCGTLGSTMSLFKRGNTTNPLPSQEFNFWGSLFNHYG